jgi:hypothetical protein
MNTHHSYFKYENSLDLSNKFNYCLGKLDQHFLDTVRLNLVEKYGFGDPEEILIEVPIPIFGRLKNRSAKKRTALLLVGVPLTSSSKYIQKPLLIQRAVEDKKLGLLQFHGR